MKSKYKQYPRYKDSGIEWLGEIPPTWVVGSLKRGIVLLTDFEANGSFADVKANVTLDSEDKYAWYLRATDLENKRKSNKRTCDERSYKFLRKTPLYGKELLVAKRGEIGKIYITPTITGKATLAPNLYLLRMNNKLDSKFAYYWYLSDYGRPQLLLADKSTTIGALYKDDVKDCRILYPPLQEQQTIANYLDKATAKIDTLIEKQTKLIELLKEKRQAVISTAVTRGLDGTVGMKDSGVEWLGEIPEGWEVKKLKYNLTLQTNKVTITNQQVIALENIAGWSGKYIPTDSKYQGDDVEFQEDDILFGKLRPYLAKVYKCENGGVAFGDILVYRPIKNTDSKFAFYAMISEAFIDIVDGSTYGSKMPRASVEFVSNMPIAVAPKLEQQQIAEYLDKTIVKIESLIVKSTKAIDLLKEKRTALISSAVTGKIDVREIA